MQSGIDIISDWTPNDNDLRSGFLSCDSVLFVRQLPTSWGFIWTPSSHLLPRREESLALATKEISPVL
jgi:hypothetical protein